MQEHHLEEIQFTDSTVIPGYIQATTSVVYQPAIRRNTYLHFIVPQNCADWNLKT